MLDSTAPKLTVRPMNEAPKPTVTIKKYANRRLYNTATSTYVTLETLSGMVKEGIEFCVYDAKTSEDITRSVLTQIIVEEEGKVGQQCLLPIGFLRQLIGFYGDNMQSLVPKYLEHSMELFANNQDQITNYFQTAFGNMFPFGTTLEEMGKKNLEMFERTMRMFAPFVPATGAESKPPHAAEPKTPVSDKANTPPEHDTIATVTAFNRRLDPTPAPVFTAPETVKEPVVVSPAPAPSAVTTPEIAAPAPETKPVAKPEPKASAASTIIPVSVPAPETKQNAPSVMTAPAAPVASTPMPNVQSMTVSSTPTADDMQQKIANLQRQLAELAKNRA